MYIVNIKYVYVYYIYVYIFIFTSLYECVYEMHIVVYLCSQQINIKETSRLFLLLLLSLSLLLELYA